MFWHINPFPVYRTRYIFLLLCIFFHVYKMDHMAKYIQKGQSKGQSQNSADVLLACLLKIETVAENHGLELKKFRNIWRDISTCVLVFEQDRKNTRQIVHIGRLRIKNTMTSGCWFRCWFWYCHSQNPLNVSLAKVLVGNIFLKKYLPVLFFHVEVFL